MSRNSSAWSGSGTSSSSSGGEPLSEHRPVVKGELVARQVVDRPRRCLLELSAPALGGLTLEAVDQVDRHGVEAPLEQPIDAPPWQHPPCGGGRGTAAPRRRTTARRGWRSRTPSSRQPATDSGVTSSGLISRTARPRGRPTAARPDGLEDPGELAHSEARGCSAAEVDGVEATARPHTAAAASRADPLDVGSAALLARRASPRSRSRGRPTRRTARGCRARLAAVGSDSPFTAHQSAMASD